MVLGLLHQVHTLFPERKRKHLADMLEDILPYFFKMGSGKQKKQDTSKTLGAGFSQYDFSRTADIPFVFSSVALAVKLAKIDSHISKEEITAFYKFFPLPKNDKEIAAELFYEAYKDTADSRSYAQKIVTLYGDDTALLLEVLIALLHLATSDGPINVEEWQFLKKIAQIFDINETALNTVLRWFILPKTTNHYALLGCTKHTNRAEIKKRYRKAVRDCHPDAIAGHAIPREIVNLMTEKFSLLAEAYEAVNKQRK